MNICWVLIFSAPWISACIAASYEDTDCGDIYPFACLATFILSILFYFVR